MSAQDDSPAAPFVATLAQVRERIGAALRSLLLFGSCLSPRTRKASSIPDLFAVVDDLDTTLVTLGVGRVARWTARILPPITLSFRSLVDGAPLAKLNLIEASVLDGELEALRDLYLAGRLSKRVELVYTRDAACAQEIGRALDRAAAAMVDVALLAPPRRGLLSEVIERCVTLSYAAEPRPERAARVRAVFDTFAAYYQARLGPLVEDGLRRRGIEIIGERFVDPRSDRLRRREARALARLLARSRWRMMARWPKQALVYRGWLPYLVQKLQRARLSA